MVVVVVVVLTTVLGAVSAPPCRRSEFACANGRCVPLNRFCDAANDCGDSSDEPRFCTPCNRTYYGDVGKTYELELHRPREDRLPFVCHLTFKAGGGDLGDLVQLTFDSFTLGRFVSFTADGCPDGSLQISEADRPIVGGSWCGTSWGAALYYSETHSVSLSLRLTRLARDQTGYNFDYRMGYKMLPRDAAIVRYGGAVPGTLHINTSTPAPLVTPVSAPTSTPEITSTNSPQYDLGDLMAGTYCSRLYTDCDRKNCRLQSPNFPGIYPRNLTCYYAVRQHDVPEGKQALIAVRQPKGQLVAIRSQSALYGPSSQQQQHRSRELKVWTECDDVQDYVTVYDGYTTRDAVLLKFCGGGEAVPEAVSSGPEILVEFTSSPYGTFLYPAPLQALHGFQLEVQVRFVDQQSPTYARNKRCEFWVRGTDKGVLETPQHSLPRNTTCLYHLQGVDTSLPPSRDAFTGQTFWRRGGTMYLPPPRYKVWLSILKFHVSSTIEPQLQEEGDCASQLKVWDGALKRAQESTKCNDIFCESLSEKDKLARFPAVISGGTSSGAKLVVAATEALNATLLATFCKDQVPRSCDHTLLANRTRAPRPCSLAESFLSSGDSLTLELRLAESTALRPVSFRALYEFVDLHQDGEQYGSGPCSRKFVSRSQGPVPEVPQKFQAPRNVFLYGRGGSPNMSCTYRFEAQRGERVKLRVTRLQTGGRSCLNARQPDLGRLLCHANCTASLRVLEQPWADTPPLARDCLCASSDELLPFTFVSTAHVVELRFVVTGMNSSDDFNNFNFEGSWEFIRTPVCARKQRLSGASGEIRFRSPSRTPDEVNCENHPWLIEPGAGRFLYVKLRGISLQQQADNATARRTEQLQDQLSLCGTRNRIALHSGGSVHVVVCPQPPSSQRHHVVEVFSEGWVISSTKLVHQPVLSALPYSEQYTAEQSRSVIVEFLAHEAGSYSLTWLELARRRSVLPPAGFVMEDCPHRCPELDACINSSLWCDGVAHCPSGFDEAAKHCSFILQLPLLYLALGAAGILVICCSLGLVACSACRRRRRSKLHRRIKSLPPDTAAIGKEVIC
ncbi:uncharacterized protein [Periplaneta americana]|uniref:uncharacterized protein n=1 Tax=Periplaneta americana TaxID=6978 RepID=UPI0037E7353E